MQGRCIGPYKQSTLRDKRKVLDCTMMLAKPSVLEGRCSWLCILLTAASAVGPCMACVGVRNHSTAVNMILNCRMQEL